MIKEEREKLYKEVKKLHKQGVSVQDIARIKKITRQMVYKILGKIKRVKGIELDKYFPI